MEKMEQLDSMRFFFFNDTATTEIYTLSLHDALPICHLHAHRCAKLFLVAQVLDRFVNVPIKAQIADLGVGLLAAHRQRSEEHTSELQSRQYLVCRLLLEKKTTSIPPPQLLFSVCPCS